MGFGEMQLHCPKDGTPMVKEDMRGITIDRCPLPTCRGVFTDGPKHPGGPDELTAIISHVGSQPGFNASPVVAQQYYAGHGTYASHTPPPPSYYRDSSGHYGDSSGHRRHGHGGHGHRKQRGFLDELFD